MDNGRSDIRGYLIDFLRHLQKTADHREDFMLFYEAWRPIRDDTIDNLESLLKGIRTGEFVCEVGGAVSSAGGAATGIPNIATFLKIGALLLPVLGIAAAAHGLKARRWSFNGISDLATFFKTGALLLPVLGIAAAAAHGLKAGFAAGKAVAVSRARQRTSTLINRDYKETSGFVNLGLQFDGVLREMREIVKNIRRMSLGYTPEQLRDVVGSIAFPVQGVNPALPQREIAQALVQAAQNIDEADMENVGEILGTFFQNNPDVVRAGRAALQPGFDLVGLTRLMREPIISNPFGGADLCFQHLYVAASVVNIPTDVRDLRECIVRLKTGGSITQDTVQNVVERLKRERSWLETVHIKLRC